MGGRNAGLGARLGKTPGCLSQGDGLVLHEMPGRIENWWAVLQLGGVAVSEAQLGAEPTTKISADGSQC